ncbi:MAG: precorrin-2 dehydrogenase/sirohydrochlorin ferrochelatase family protein [Bacillota bacterium]
MYYYPINLNLNKKKVLLVGGGKVAFRKFKSLVKAGALIKIVSPKLNDDFSNFLDKDKDNYESLNYKYIPRSFHKNDLENVFMVFAASNKKKLNKKIAQLSNKKKVLCNIVDNKNLSDFILPAVIDRGDFLLTFSTSGNLPALSKQLREDFEKEFGEEYEFFLEMIGVLRKEIIAKIDNIKTRKRIFHKLAKKELIEDFVSNPGDVFAKIEKIINEELEGDYDEKKVDNWDKTKQVSN